MKKMIALLLALLLTSLCGCSNTPQDGQAPQNKPESEIQNAETDNMPTVSATLQFSFGPEFTLSLDEEQNILSADAENEDASALFAQLELTGMPYDEAITAILDAAYIQGYPEDGSMVTVTVDMPQSPTSSIGVVDLPIASFKREKGITSGTIVKLREDPIFKGKSVVVDGRKYNISVEPLYDGNRSDKKLVQVGTITKCICKWLTEEDPPTSYSKKEIIQFDNGDAEVSFYHNNLLLRRLKVNGNGEITDYSYYTEEKEAIGYIAYANGDYCYYAYTEDGTSLGEEFLLNGDFHFFRCQDDGSFHYYDAYADGNRREEILGPDGIPVYLAEYYANGTAMITSYYDNGNIQTQEELFDGFTILSTYDENGKLMSHERIEADGTVISGPVE